MSHKSSNSYRNQNLLYAHDVILPSVQGWLNAIVESWNVDGRKDEYSKKRQSLVLQRIGHSHGLA